MKKSYYIFPFSLIRFLSHRYLQRKWLATPYAAWMWNVPQISVLCLAKSFQSTVLRSFPPAPISLLRSCKKGKGNLQGGGGEGNGRWPAILVCPRPSWFQHWKFHTWEKAIRPEKNIASHFICPAPKRLVIGRGVGGKGKCPAICWTTQIPHRESLA